METTGVLGARERTAPPRIRTGELAAGIRIAVARLNRRLRAEKPDGDLTDVQYSVLALLHREGPSTLGALSEHERVTPPSMTKTVGRLVAAGYVEREGDPADARRVVLRCSATGGVLVVETRRRRDAWLERRLAALSADDRRTLDRAAAILVRMADS